MIKSEFIGNVESVASHRIDGWVIKLHIPEVNHLGMEQTTEVKSLMDLLKKNVQVAVVELPGES